MQRNLIPYHLNQQPAQKTAIKGKSTLRGKTNDVSIPVKMDVGEQVRIKGQFDIKRWTMVLKHIQSCLVKLQTKKR